MPRERDDEDDDDTPIRRHTRKRSGIPAWTWWTMGSLGVVFAVVTVVAVVRSGSRGDIPPSRQQESTHNASCPQCGKRFSLPEDWIGTVAEQTRSVSCPRCEFECPPWMFFGKNSKVNR